jgi:branched-chain amino acid transport system ATP-binding protein
LAAHNMALRVASLAARYGKIVAVRNASLEIAEGEAIALLGANGSGKTTLLNTVCGFLKPAGGTISLGEEDIGGLPPHVVFQHGVVQVAQGRELFGSMTVLDNLQLGAVRRNRPGPELAEIFAYFPRLRERQQQIVRTGPDVVATNLAAG